MKTVIFAITLLVSFSAFSSQEDSVYRINLDWNNPRTLEDGVAMMCDDAYYSHAEIVVPGQESKDFDIVVDGVFFKNGQMIQNCEVSKKKGTNATKYYIKAEGSCTIEIRQKPYSIPSKKATYEFVDAC